MNEISQFESPCHYQDGDMYCSNGNIYIFEPGRQMASLAVLKSGSQVESTIKCPACKGRGYVLTPAGQQLVEMVWRHIHPWIEESFF